MPRTPVIAFSGQFFFQMPEYNNDPKLPGVAFDPSLGLDNVKLIAGSDPADYFKFRAQNCAVTSVSWSDGNEDESDAELIGLPVELTGFMVDISPSAICAVIYAGRLRLGQEAFGTMAPAYQSDLRLNVRPKGFADITAAAHYISDLTLDKPTTAKISALRSLASEVDNQIVFQVNHYTKAVDDSGQIQPGGLLGDIYGVIRRKGRPAETLGPRIANRRLVAHPEIGGTPAIEKLFLTDTGGGQLARITDIDGYYDIDNDARHLMLRPLDFVPFLDFDYTTPTSAGLISSYVVYAIVDGERKDLSSYLGTHKEMLKTGGVVSIDISSIQGDLSRLSVGIDVVTPDGSRFPLMTETEWDIELVNCPRGLKLASKAVQRLGLRVFKNNIPMSNIQVSSRARNDTRSPTVADIYPLNGGISDSFGLVQFDVVAKDLTKLGNIPDPVTGEVIDKVSLDRQYGSAIYLSIPNPLRRAQVKVEEIEICVRVLPIFEASSIVGLCSFTRDVAPMLGYYTRFFPWIHTRHSGSGYRRFFDLQSFASAGAHLDEMLRRIRLPDDDVQKMPRSRDLPIGVADVLERWRADGWQP